ncbi:MAG: hypothetical protein AB8B86_02750 [Pseudomonadales bacterium]
MHNIAIQQSKGFALFPALLTLLVSILSTLPASAETYLSTKDEELMHALKAEAMDQRWQRADAAPVQLQRKALLLFCCAQWAPIIIEHHTPVA